MESIIQSSSGLYPIVAVGHNFFHEGSYTDYGGAEILASVSAFKKCDAVIMGHHHQFRILNKKSPIAIYSGSMEKMNFGDENVDKYYIDYETKTKKTKILKIPTKELLDFSIDLSNCTAENIADTLKKELSKIQVSEKIVRAKAIVKDKLSFAIKKNEIERILYDDNASYVSKVIVEPIISRIIRNSEILEHKDDYKMFDAFVRGQDLDKDLRDSVLREAKGIIK